MRVSAGDDMNLKSKLIGEIAEYYGISADTLRYYERIGLFTMSRNEANNYRLFDREHLIFIDYITHLRRMGIPLKEVKTISKDMEIGEADMALRKHEEYLKSKVEEYELKLAMIADYRRTFGRILEKNEGPEIMVSPRFVCMDIKDSVVNVLREFRQINLAQMPKFTYHLSMDRWESEDWERVENPEVRDTLMRPAFSLALDPWEDSEGYLPEKGFRMRAPSKCVHCLISVYTYKDYSALRDIRRYILENGFELTASPILRTIHLKYFAEAYYEFWAPIK